MKRLLALTLGLAVAAAALYLLVSREPPSASKAPRAEIDDASRAKLERVLREAENRGGD